MSGWPTNLPRSTTSFIGRAHERERTVEAMRSTRVVVLTGPGGVGKSRLAVEVARQAAADHPDGAWWVELAPLADGSLVGTALAEVLAVRPLPGHTPAQAAAERLGDDRALVVLDNCEHLLDAAAQLCETLLRDCPNVTVLATSREGLGMAGEADLQVPSLELPAERGPGGLTADAIRASDAGRVFVERALNVRSTFTLTDDNAASVARICRELDGLPLAIELAAARVRVLSVEQIAARLDERLRLLTTAPRGATARQKTLRGSVDWSYELLAEPERVLFRRLAVFAGGWSLDAVAAVCADDGLRAEGILDLLDSLVAKSLVLAEERDGTMRYRMLETVRQYAQELVELSGELAALGDRHLRFFLELAESAAPVLETPRNLELLRALEPDSANIDAALQLGSRRSPEEGLRLAIALTMWWNMRGRFAVGQDAIERALATASAEPSATRARAIWSSGHLASYRGDYAASVSSFERSGVMARTVGDDSTEARAIFSLAALGLSIDPAASRAPFDRAIELARSANDQWALMSTLTTLAWSFLMTEQYGEAMAVYSDAGAAIESTGLEGAVWRSLGLGWSAMALGDQAAARVGFDEGIAFARTLGDPVTEGFGTVLLCRLEMVQGRFEAVVERARVGEDAANASGAFMVIPSTRIELARGYAAMGRLTDARDILVEIISGGADQGWTLCEALLALAEVERWRGDVGEARRCAERALEMSETVGADALGASARESLARLAIRRGDAKAAQALAHAAVAERVVSGSIARHPHCLDPLAFVAAAADSFETAARILGATERALEQQGIVRSPLDELDVASVEAMLREQLGEEGLLAAKARGAGMPFAEAVAWIRRARGPRSNASRGWASLTPTESRVVELVVEGLTNPQVAERLFVSRATVKVHLAHVFRKLDVASRAELAAMAVRENG